MAYDNTNSGALFTNKRKEKDNHPSHTGTANIDGVEYWISAWVKTLGTGERFFSMAYKRKDQQPSRTAPPPTPQSGMGFDDDVPF